MNVIADTRSVGRRIIRPEHGNLRAEPYCSEKENGNQVRLGRMILAQGPIRGGAGDVEVTQGHKREIAVRGPVVAEDLLHAPFRPTVGVDRLLPHRFHNRRCLGFAVGGAGGTEHHPLYTRLLHGLEQTDAAGRVVVVVDQRLADRLAHVGQGGEVHDAIDRLFAEHLDQSVRIGQRDLAKRARESTARRWPRKRLSTTATRCPAASNCLTACDPM